MDAHDYLDRILELYAPTFDIERQRKAGGVCFDAYGFFSSLSEKYVLVKDARLWAVNTYEHAFFKVVDGLSKKDIDAAGDLIKGPLQSGFVTKGKKYPEKDHMHSLITVVYVSRKAVGEDAVAALGRFRYDRSYLFNFRGYCEGRIIAVDLEDSKVYTSKAASSLKGLYEGAMDGSLTRRI